MFCSLIVFSEGTYVCLSIAKCILLFASARRDEISSREELIAAKKTGMKMINSESYVKNVLGVLWNLSKDKFFFTSCDIAETAESLPVTKKNILKTSALFFDLLGL